MKKTCKNLRAYIMKHWKKADKNELKSSEHQLKMNRIEVENIMV